MDVRQGGWWLQYPISGTNSVQYMLRDRGGADIGGKVWASGLLVV